MIETRSSKYQRTSMGIGSLVSADVSAVLPLVESAVEEDVEEDDDDDWPPEFDGVVRGRRCSQP